MHGFTAPRALIVVALATLWPVPAAAAEGLTRRLTARSDLQDVAQLAPRILVKLAYSGPQNFLGRDLYGDLERCFLAREVAPMLARAEQQLRRLRPDLRLLVYDCVRPRSVQRAMWRRVKGTPQQPYVANPRNLSLHNLGCAVDLTLADASGKPLTMGSAFDHAGPLSQPRLERRLRLSGRLSAEAWANRLLLRQVMVQAGFLPLALEWWHFDCASRRQALRRFKPVP